METALTTAEKAKKMGLPIEVGGVPVHWTKAKLAPDAAPDRFRIALFGGVRFFLFKSGRQFLYFAPGIERDGQGRWVNRDYFGGVDERAIFLTGIRPQLSEVFQNGGEDSFFTALKPEHIRRLELKYGPKTKRQGDIFAFPLPWKSWREINRAICIPFNDKDPLFQRRWRLFGTRHIHDGRYVSNVSIPRICGCCVIVDGVIEAPDHAPLVLETPHVVSRARGLMSPRLSEE